MPRQPGKFQLEVPRRMDEGSLCIISFNAASAGCGNTGALSGGASSKSPDEFSVIMLEALRKKLCGSA